MTDPYADLYEGVQDQPATASDPYADLYEEAVPQSPGMGAMVPDRRSFLVREGARVADEAMSGQWLQAAPRFAEALARSAVRNTPLGDVQAGAEQGATDLMRALAVAAGNLPAAREIGAEGQRVADRRAQELGAIPFAWDRGAGMVSGAARSLTATAPAMITGPAGMIAAGAAQTGLNAYADADEKGLDHEQSLAYALRQGGMEGLPAAIAQRFGLGGLETVLGKLARQGVQRISLQDLMRQAAISTGQELPEELLTTLGQYPDQMITLEGRLPTAGELGGALIDTAGQVAVMGGMTHAPHAGRIVADSIDQRRADAQAVAGAQRQAALAAMDPSQAQMEAVSAPEASTAWEVLAEQARSQEQDRLAQRDRAALAALPETGGALPGSYDLMDALAARDESLANALRNPPMPEVPNAPPAVQPLPVAPAADPGRAPAGAPAAPAAPAAAPVGTAAPVDAAGAGGPLTTSNAAAPAPAGQPAAGDAPNQSSFSAGQRVRYRAGKSAGREATVEQVRPDGRLVLRLDNGKQAGAKDGITPSNLEVVDAPRPSQPAAPAAPATVAAGGASAVQPPAVGAGSAAQPGAGAEAVRGVDGGAAAPAPVAPASWQSPRGTRRVVGEAVVRGERMVRVHTDGAPDGVDDLFRPAELERERRIDEANVASAERSRAAADREAKLEAERNRTPDDVEAFTAGLPAMQAGGTKKALGKLIGVRDRDLPGTVNGEVVGPRSEVVRRLVAAGYAYDQAENALVKPHADGRGKSIMGSAQLAGVGVRFGKFLSERQVTSAQAPAPADQPALPSVGSRVRVSVADSASWTGTVVRHVDRIRAMVRPDDARSVPMSMRPNKGSDVGVHARFLSSDPEAKSDTGSPRPMTGDVADHPREPKASVIASAAAGMKPRQSNAFNEAVTQAIADVAVRLDGGETGSVKLTSAALAWLRDVDVGHDANGKPTRDGVAMAKEIIAIAKEAHQRRVERRANDEAKPIASGEPSADARSAEPAYAPPGPEAMGLPPGDDPVSPDQVPDGFNTQGRGDPQAQRFVLAPNGGLDWGAIDAEVAHEINRQTGPIRLQVGWHGGPGSGFGLVHLRLGGKYLGKDLDALSSVLHDYDEVRQDGMRLILVKQGSGKRPDGAFVELVPGDHYSVITAYGLNNKDAKGSLLWSRSTTRTHAPQPEAPGLPDTAAEGRSGPPKAAQQGNDGSSLPQESAPGNQQPRRDIADVGEKIGGARKDRLRLDDLDAMTDEERQANVTRDAVWPDRDDAQAVADGQPAEVAHLVKQARQAIAAKPGIDRTDAVDPAKRDAAIRSYVEMVGRLRDGLEQAKSLDAVRAVIKGEWPGLFQPGFGGYHGDGVKRRADDLARYRVVAKGNTLANVGVGSSWTRARREVAAGWPSKAAWQSRYQVGQSIYAGRDNRWVVKARNESLRRDERAQERSGALPEDFATRQEAENEAARRYAGLTKATRSQEPERPLRPDAKRDGPERRDGDVSADDLRSTYGFRGIEFGTWTNQADRQQAVNQAHDGLADLAEVMGIPGQAISLEGKLGLGFGSRGKGGRAAGHYEPGRVVINLTRTKGSGIVAHEWAHAFDNYLGKSGSGGKVDAYSSASDPTREDPEGRAGVRPEIRLAWQQVRQAMLWRAPGKKSNYLIESQAADGKTRKYWATPHEMFARAFEGWVAQRLSDRGMFSPYLVHGVPGEESDIATASPWDRRYPMGEDAKRINAAIDHLVSTLKTEQAADGTTRLYQNDPIPGDDASRFDGGPVFRGMEGDYDAARDALERARSGEVIGALHHPDIGFIDLPWGVEGTNAHDGYGLAKLLRWHPEVAEALPSILRGLPVVSRTSNRVQLDDGRYRAAVRLQHDGQDKTWLLTAFEKKDADRRTGVVGDDATGRLPRDAGNDTNDGDKNNPSGRLYGRETIPGDHTPPADHPKEPPVRDGIEAVIAWAKVEREQVIGRMGVLMNKAKNREARDAYGDVRNAYQSVDPDELAEHMRQFPGHYLRAATAAGGHLDPIQVFVKRETLPPLEPRIMPAPLTGEQVPSHRESLRELHDALRSASRSAPAMDVDKGLSGKAGGFYDPSNQRVVVKYHNDLDLVAHEVGHWAAETWGLLPPATTEDGRKVRAELARLGVHGSKAHGELLLREGMAEGLRAWMVNPVEAERRAPGFLGLMQEAVPPPVLSALRAYGDNVRRFAGADDVAKIGAGVLGTKEGMAEERRNGNALRMAARGMAAVFGFGKKQRAMRPGIQPTGWARDRWEAANGVKEKAQVIADQAQFQITDRDAPMTDNYLMSLELAGIDPGKLSPLEHWNVMRTGMLGQNGRIRDMVTKYGLAMPDLSVSVDQKTGERMNLAWLLDPITTKALDDDSFTKLIDRAHAYGVAERSLELAERWTRQTEAEIAAFIEARSQETGDRSAAVQDEIAAYAKEKRDALRMKLARITGAGAGIESATEVARKAMAELERDPDRDAIREYLRRYRAWSNWNLDYAVASDLLTKEQAARMKRGNQFYIDWHRVFGEDDAPIDIGEAVDGSMRTIHNPLASLLHATWSAVTRGDRNRLMLSFTAPLRMAQAGDGAMAQLGRQISEEEAEKARKQDGYHDDLAGDRRRVYRLQRTAQAIDEHGQPLLENGVPVQEVVTEHWVFDAGTEASLEAGRRIAGDHPWMTLMRGLNGLQRSMITLAPGFRLKVPVRDSIEQLMNSEARNSPASVVKDTAGILRHTIDVDGRSLDELFSLSGASMAGYNAQGREAAIAEVAKMVEDMRATGIRVLSTDGLAKAWHLYQRFGEEAENLARKREFLAVYREKRAQGMSVQEAAAMAMMSSRDLLDTAKAGNLTGQMNGIVLFLNASVQGMVKNTKMARAAVAAASRGDHAVAARLAGVLGVRVAAFAAVSVMARMAWLAAMDDDEERKKALREPAFKRDFAFRFNVPGIGPVAVPKPYEWGFITSGFDRLADYAMARSKGWDADAKNAFDGYAGSFAHAVMPLDQDMVAGSFAPIVEVMTNHSFFTGGSIVAPYEAGLSLDARKGQEHASALGRGLGAVLHADARNVDHLIRGYFGGFGSMATARTWGEFAKRATGYSGSTSLYSSRDVEWVMEEAASRGGSQRAPIQALRRLLKEERTAATEEIRARTERRALGLAAKLRGMMEEKPEAFSGSK